MTKTTLLQFFHWYYPDGGKLWQEAAERAPHRPNWALPTWLPPAYKGASGGYPSATILRSVRSRRI